MILSCTYLNTDAFVHNNSVIESKHMEHCTTFEVTADLKSVDKKKHTFTTHLTVK